jgi:signal transduction histidine kinase
VIRDVLESDGLSVDGPGAILAAILDAATTAAVQSYVEARDLEAQRRQAEHIGFLTHELRSPLSTAVLAASQLRLDATAEQELPLQILERNHRRLSDLIDSVLLTEQLAFGSVELRRVQLRLGQIMDGALEAARAVAAHKGLEIVTDYDPELLVDVDPLLTRSALQNLADNAAKYTDAGQIHVTVDNRPDALVFHVRDACGGIPSAELQMIFDSFRRGTTMKPGTGLGLAIAKRATEAQGGTLHVESYEAPGCHFWITLPKTTNGGRGSDAARSGGE